jgi:hypothetical protein
MSATRTRKRRGLNGLFDTLNERYWDGRLPRCRVTTRKSLWPAWGVADKKKRLISIHPSLLEEGQEEKLMCTLLHEMCHIAAGPWHGKRFLQELKRLGKWGEFDTVLYSGEKPKISWRKELQEAVENATLDICTINHDCRWETVRRAVAHKYLLKPKELERRYPELRRIWAQTRANVFAREELKAWFEAASAEEGQ